MSVPNDTDVQHPARVAEAGLETEAEAARDSGAPGECEPGGILTVDLLNKIRQRLSETPDVRRGKVEPLKTAIANGAYRVAAGDIADAMLRGIRL